MRSAIPHRSEDSPGGVRAEPGGYRHHSSYWSAYSIPTWQTRGQDRFSRTSRERSRSGFGRAMTPLSKEYRGSKHATTSRCAELPQRQHINFRATAPNSDPSGHHVVKLNEARAFSGLAWGTSWTTRSLTLTSSSSAGAITTLDKHANPRSKRSAVRDGRFGARQQCRGYVRMPGTR